MSEHHEIGPAPLVPGAYDSPIEVAAEVRRHAQALWSSAIIHAAARLRIADLIDEEPVSVTDLARKAGADEAALLRLLRALDAHGLFRHVGEDRYVHTEYSRTLRSDSASGVLNLSLLGASEWNWTVWARLADAVRTGRPAFPDVYGKDLYRYFAEDDPEAGAVFNRAMSESGKWTTGPVAASLDMTGVTTVADVGGGQGGLLRAILERYSDTTGTLIDSPQVLKHVDPVLRQAPLAQRYTEAPADIRESVPAKADLYILRQVMHIWDDETCVGILRNCAASARPGAKLVLVEHVITPEARPNSTFSTLIDLTMMLIGPGRERTAAQFADVMSAAGFTFTGVVDTPTPLKLLVGALKD
nr:O-methyltransferase [Actinoallomurus sp.]